MPRILGIDLGEKRIGIAVSDALNIIAQGVGVIERRGIKDDVKKIQDLIKQHDISKIIIGLPVNMDGTKGKSARIAIDFADLLKSETSVSIEMIDERLTTRQGERVLLEADVSRRKRKAHIDKIAAQLILQNYLDSYVQKDNSL
jgi:putative Holliday junction resolvase